MQTQNWDTACENAPLTEFTGGGSGRCVDGCGRSAGLDPPEHSLPAVPAMRPGAGCLWGFLPVVIEGDQFPLRKRRAGREGVSGGTWRFPAPSVGSRSWAIAALSPGDPDQEQFAPGAERGLLTTVWLRCQRLGKRAVTSAPESAPSGRQEDPHTRQGFLDAY